MSSSITINGNVVQLADLTPSADAANTNYLLIKGATDLGQQEKRQLAEKGVKVYEYLGENVYLCYYEPSELEPIQQLDFVDAAVVYARRVKTSALLKQALGDGAGQAPSSDGARVAATAPTFDIEVVLHKGEGQVDGVVDQIAQTAGVDPADVSVDHNKLRLTCDADGIGRIEKLDAVRAIEKHVPKKLYNNLARGDLEIDEAVANEHVPKSQYEGNGQVVAVSDTGFDTGSKTDTHPAFTGRVRALLPVGRKSTGQTNDFQGHGTHVAGSVLGDGSSDTMGGKIRGAAPKAELVMQSLLTTSGGLQVPPNLWDLFVGPHRDNKARIATNSWGPDWQLAGSRQVGYDSEADALDKFVWHNQDHVILFAAGNDGSEPSATNAQIGSSSAAKNCIAVGATQSSRTISDGLKYDPAGTPGNPSAVALFSSRGPTLEKRQKPDVVAPGVAILSTASRDPAARKQAARQSFGPSKDVEWMFDTGTSMATPLAAGCCALLREALDVKAGVAKPSAALVKALLINGAVDLGLPRAEQGFGRIDVARSLAIVEKHDAAATNGSSTNGGQTWTKEVTIPSGGTAGEFKVTLAYSDRAGEALQNKLSLSVRFSGGSNGAADVEKLGAEGNQGLTENNVEQVVLKQGQGGRYSKATITVKADRITRLDDVQAFAVAWGMY
ncbi:peptidase S8/S53 domain-containing protein [Microdochium trichocladiopsis]|uniref:Peptidase S8/S53 domain-containing protein n=1 Tax=Microdochium trichocladiopsis TaxID=1682393 RepID=A0A9P8Y853_9PEZI|nr:peptidase S8/S53 domain-containing protein [Microdochium trichocladiopsis]KAH7029931.1 peptidase S8/S53 domain-containing protein [Microdochium trichocladiopsis]